MFGSRAPRRPAQGEAAGGNGGVSRIVGDPEHMTVASFTDLISTLRGFSIQSSFSQQLGTIPPDQISKQDTRLENFLRWLINTFFPRDSSDKDLLSHILNRSKMNAPSAPTADDLEGRDERLAEAVTEFYTFFQQFVLNLIAHTHTLDYKRRFHRDARTSAGHALWAKWALVLSSVLRIYDEVNHTFSSSYGTMPVAKFWTECIRDNMEHVRRLNGRKLELMKQQNDAERELYIRDMQINDIMQKYSSIDAKMPLIAGEIEQIEMDLERLHTGGDTLKHFDSAAAQGNSTFSDDFSRQTSKLRAPLAPTPTSTPRRP